MQSRNVRCQGWTLLGDHSSRCGARRLFCRRDHEGDPGVPTVRPVLVGELPVAFKIEVSLRRCAQGDNESKLRAYADDARLEAAHTIAGTAVATDLLVDVAHESGLKLFRQKLRCTPIEMHVDAVSDIASTDW